MDAGLSRALHYMFMAFQRHPFQNQRTMFITTNTQHRVPIFRDPAFANEAVLALYKAQQIYPFFLYGFVIMPDHSHLLLQVPEGGSISKVMYTFKRAAAFALDQGPIWQSRFLIVYPDDPAAALSYIHQNPVKAGLSMSSEAYPWSSASGKHDVSPLPYYSG